MRFDDMLTSDGKGFNIEKLKEMDKNGLKFPSELLRMAAENERLRKESAVKDEEIARRDEEIKKKDKQIGRLKYSQRVNGLKEMKNDLKKRLKKYINH